MRCLFVSEHWKGGSGSLIQSRIEMFENSRHSVFFVGVHKSGYHSDFIDFFDLNSGSMRRDDYYEMEIKKIAKRPDPLKSILRIAREPSYAFLSSAEETRSQWRGLVEDVNPDVIWVEHLRPATFVAQITSSIPIIYSHHDWSWRIKNLRTERSLKSTLKFWIRKRHEIELVRKVDASVSASASETEQIQSFGGEAIYLPITYEPLDLDTLILNSGKPRIVHLGGMGTTANRIGLQRFLDESWPILEEELSDLPELWVVGSLSGAPDSLLTRLESVGAVCTGYVKDLTTVLCPYDIHIVPWEYDTGVRTRVPLILNYMQTLVAVEAGVACFPELRSGDNCLLAQDLSELASVLVDVISDRRKRQRIAEEGRDTFLAHFTREAVQPEFNELLERLNGKIR